MATAAAPRPGFESLGLSSAPLRAAQLAGFSQPTAIQAAAIPVALRGADLIARAHTGSGKTLAYALPLLELLPTLLRTPASAPAAVPRGSSRRRTLALVLVPTRDLALQVGETILAIARHLPQQPRVATVFGGVSINPQMMALRGGAEVVVATPGRLLDLVAQNALRLGDVGILVLDEADRLLDEGFAEDLARITQDLPGRRHTWLYSATFSEGVKALAEATLREPETIEVADSAEAGRPDVTQRAIVVDSARRTALLKQLVGQHPGQRVLVFVATRYSCEHVARKLQSAGIAADAFHGDLSQGARSRLLADLGSGALQVLLATDMAARGLHIPGLALVVNYDLPRSPDDHLHRIGRTARAGASGLAISFVPAAAEAHFRVIEKRQGLRVPREVLPGFEPQETAPPPSPAEGGIKGRRKSRKDKLREAAARGA